MQVTITPERGNHRANSMETINVRDEGAIRILEMDRPEALNAFSNLLMDELTDAFHAAAEDDAVKVVVLTGAGRAFSAGALLFSGMDDAHHGVYTLDG